MKGSRILLIGGAVVGVLGIVISLAASAAKTDIARREGASTPTTEADVMPEPGYRAQLSIIGADATAAGKELSTGFGPKTTAACTKLRTDVETAGRADGWTPAEGKVTSGTDDLYVEVLNQAHQSATACLARDVAGANTHSAAAVDAIKALSAAS